MGSSPTSSGYRSCASLALSPTASLILTASFFFFGGLSIHLSTAILAHLFSYNITWSATKKEVERSNFFKEVPKIIKRFWVAWGISIIIFAGMAVLTTNLVPFEWRIAGDAWAVIFPLSVVCGCHILFPVRFAGLHLLIGISVLI